MWEINLELKEYIEQNILPLYEAHDAAHGPEHVRTVLENSFDLLDGLDVDQNMVYTVAAYHDVGVRGYIGVRLFKWWERLRIQVS